VGEVEARSGPSARSSRPAPQKSRPLYPEIARQARVEGVVIVEATTDIYGGTDVKVLRSIPLLDQSAIDAVRSGSTSP